MFFIFGINNGFEPLNFRQNIICPCCGKYGALEAFKQYNCASLFFIPVFYWNKQYYLRTTCCGSICFIDKELGKKIADGTITSLDVNQFNFTRDRAYAQVKRCPSCGFETKEDFDFCPKCGRRF